jgi:hypothetical protein
MTNDEGGEDNTRRLVPVGTFFREIINMAKQTRAEKSTDSKPEESFVNLMMMAAEFASSRGGIEAAKLALHDTGRFIEQAGGVGKAARALDVLESLKSKIGS